MCFGNSFLYDKTRSRTIYLKNNMNDIIHWECQIYGPTINSRRELIYKIRVKEYDENIKNAVYDAADSWNPFVLVAKPFAEHKQTDQMPAKRAKLAHLMKIWCDQEAIQESQEIQRVYNKYNVTSRSDLTEDQIDKEIESYSTWINYHIN